MMDTMRVRTPSDSYKNYGPNGVLSDSELSSTENMCGGGESPGSFHRNFVTREMPPFGELTER